MKAVKILWETARHLWVFFVLVFLFVLVSYGSLLAIEFAFSVAGISNPEWAQFACFWALLCFAFVYWVTYFEQETDES